MSRLGMGAAGFYETCPAELHYALLDQSEREQIAIELPIRAIWETTRIAIMFQHNMSPYRKRAIKKASDVFALRWDDEERPVQSLDQMKQVVQAIHTAFGGVQVRRTRPNKPKSARIRPDNKKRAYNTTKKTNTPKTAEKQQGGTA